MAGFFTSAELRETQLTTHDEKKQTENNFFAPQRKTVTYNAKLTKEIDEDRTIDINCLTISEIDEKVRYMLVKRCECIQPLYTLLFQTLNIYERTIDQVEKKKAQIKINNIRILINNIELMLEYGKYIDDTHLIVKKDAELDRSTACSFFAYNNEVEKKKKCDYVRDKLRREYLTIVDQYAHIESNERRGYNQFRCRNEDCLGSQFVYDGNIYICLDCSTSNATFDDTASFKDTERVNTAPRFKYSQHGHLKEAIFYFQGKQPIKNEEKVLKRVHQEMKNNGLTKENMQKRELYIILNTCGLSANYNDINAIYSKITGKPSPDIHHLIDKIYEFDRQYSIYYPQVKDEERLSFQNVYFRLYKYLQMCEFEISISDFFSLKTIDVLSCHINKFEEVRQKAEADGLVEWKKYNDV